ncbi:hypothetical protein ABIE65_003784 [Constrictibacter sp. MBR-5]|jgi:hypothetical protein
MRRIDGSGDVVTALEEDARLEWTRPVLHREDPRDAESGFVPITDGFKKS